jgi:hypothetical protein
LPSQARESALLTSADLTYMDRHTSAVNVLVLIPPYSLKN